MTLTKVLNIVILSAVLSGCSLFSPVKVVVTKKYTLDETPMEVPSQKNRSLTLFVSEPESRPIYNTTQMAYTTQPHQIAFFSQNEWSETPSQMLHPLILKTLQNT